MKMKEIHTHTHIYTHIYVTTCIGVETAGGGATPRPPLFYAKFDLTIRSIASLREGSAPSLFLEANKSVPKFTFRRLKY